MLSSRVCDAAQRAHTVPTGGGTKTSGVSTDLLIPPKQGNALSPPAVGPSPRENGREERISSWGEQGGAKPELEVGMEGAGSGCCSTIPLQPCWWGDVGGSLAVQ